MARTKRLPNKPSALIKVAMDDLNKVERLKGYAIDMGTWHRKRHSDDPCHVCFAGAVIAQTLKADPDVVMLPSMYEGDTSQKLAALDLFRFGSVGRGFSEMGLNWRVGIEFNLDVPGYLEDRRGFKLAMRKLIRDLKAANL